MDDGATIGEEVGPSQVEHPGLCIYIPIPVPGVTDRISEQDGIEVHPVHLVYSPEDGGVQQVIPKLWLDRFPGFKLAITLGANPAESHELSLHVYEDEQILDIGGARTTPGTAPIHLENSGIEC